MYVFMCYNSVTQYTMPRGGGGHIIQQFVVFLQQRNLFSLFFITPIKSHHRY